MKAYRILIKDLNYFQKCELAMRTNFWIFFHETFLKKQIAPIGKAGEINLFTVFKMAGHSDHSAKIQSKKVVDKVEVKNEMPKLYDRYFGL